GEAHRWHRSPVLMQHQIRGLGPITISVPDRKATDLVLTRVLGMSHVRDYATPGNEGSRTYVYHMGAGGPAAELHVAEEPNLPVAEPGAGGVHHVAFRIPDADYQAWTERIQSLRLPSSGPVDRFYFRSLYFREPNGILFEIATDGPGFATDEPLESLGEKLSLPPFLEGKRQQIEASLRPL
ncbi:MAG: VOC family protein, partial [Microvirga sp.]